MLLYLYAYMILCFKSG